MPSIVGFGFGPYRLKLLAFSLSRRPGAPIPKEPSQPVIFFSIYQDYGLKIKQEILGSINGWEKTPKTELNRGDNLVRRNWLEAIAKPIFHPS